MSDTLVEAVIAARKAMAPLVANETANMGKYSFKYVKLHTLLDVVQTALLEQGVLLVQYVGNDGEGITIETKLLGKDGAPIQSGRWYVSPPDNIFEMSKYITTCRRIQLMALLGLSPGDDDDSQGQPGDDRERQGAQPPMGTRNQSEGTCPECHAPAGRPHATTCKRGGAVVLNGGRQPASGAATPSPSGDVDFGMDKAEPSPTAFVDFVAGLKANPFYEETLKASGISTAGRSFEVADKEPSVTYMPTKPAEGKKMSQYGYLCSLIDKVCDDKGAHTVVLSYLVGRPVSHLNPPPYPVKNLIDNLVSEDENIKAKTEETLRTIYETCMALWEEEKGT